MAHRWPLVPLLAVLCLAGDARDLLATNESGKKDRDQQLVRAALDYYAGDEAAKARNALESVSTSDPEILKAHGISPGQVIDASAARAQIPATVDPVTERTILERSGYMKK